MSLLVSLSILTSCQENGSSGSVTLKFSILGVNKTEQVAFNNETLLEIIQKNHTIKTKETLFTKYTFCVDEVCNEGDYSWVYFMNGKLLSLSIDIYKPEDKDIIELRYGELSSFNKPSS